VTDVYKEFKEFISRGNVIDLAVAVVIGLAVVAIVNAIVAFLFIAAAVFFFIVKPVNMLNERRRRGEEPEAELSDEAALLTEIRDLLRDRSGV
jgi:large conductance mechanosensitive channel